MARAIVVFANGSKQLAHNTDDLLFRWAERKAANVSEIVQQHENGISIRDCSDCESIEQAHRWRLQLLQQLNVLNGQIAVLKACLPEGQYLRQSWHLRKSRDEIRGQIAWLNAFDKAQKWEAQQQAVENANARQQRVTETLALQQQQSEATHARKMERIAAANAEQRERAWQLHRVLRGLYLAVLGGDASAIDEAMSAASVFMSDEIKSGGSERA